MRLLERNETKCDGGDSVGGKQQGSRRPNRTRVVCAGSQGGEGGGHATTMRLHRKGGGRSRRRSDHVVRGAPMQLASLKASRINQPPIDQSCMFFCSSGLDIYSKRGVAERRLPRMPSPAQHNCLAMQPMRGGTEWPMALNWSSTMQRNRCCSTRPFARGIVDPCPPLHIYLCTAQQCHRLYHPLTKVCMVSRCSCRSRSRSLWKLGATAARAAPHRP